MDDIGIVVGIVVGVLVLAAIVQTWIVIHEAAVAAREYYRRENVEARMREAEETDELAGDYS